MKGLGIIDSSNPFFKNNYWNLSIYLHRSLPLVTQYFLTHYPSAAHLTIFYSA